jgi:hypothetical protein
MTSDLMVASEQIFTLEGHDCPLGEYPAVLVPIGKLAGHPVAAYSGKDRVEFQPIAATARFHHHDEVTAKSLEGFDPQKHGLFGIKPNDILTYDLGDEQRFYRRLLRSSAAFSIEPFYRLSLAFETNDPGLIRPLYERCAHQLRRQAPELFLPLVRSIPAATPAIARIQGDILDAGEMPRVAPPEAALRQIEGSAAERVPPSPIPVVAGRAVTAARVSDAVRALVYREGAGTTPWTSVHALALRASLGFWLDHQTSKILFATQLSDPSVVPRATEVAELSRLSLPHLEFANIILSRPTAVDFLKRSGVGLSRTVLLQDVLTERFYEQQFARPSAKVRQRAMFTYAELLAMVRYTGTVEFV